MSKPVNRIFSVSACPPEHVLLDYVKGIPDRHKIHEIESHLSDCDMCSDYVEGLMLIGEPDQIKVISQQLNQNIDMLAGKKKRPPFFQRRVWIASAAVIALLVAVTFILQNQFYRFKTTHEIAKTDHISEQHPVYRNAGQDMQPAEETASEKRTGSSNRTAPPLAYDMIADEDHDYTVFLETATGNTLRQTAVSETTELQEAEQSFARDYFQDEEVPVSDIVSRDARSPESSGGKKTETVAVQATTAKEYRLEETKADKAESTNPGVMLYREGLYDASLKFFEDQLKSNPYDQEAQFYFAMNLIQLGRKDEGKKILEAIATGEGKYKTQAARELKKISRK